MIEKMREIPLSQAEPGMVLAVTLCASDGADILAAGTVLTPPILSTLQQRSISRLQIAETEDLPPELPALQKKEITERVHALFRRCDNDPLMAKLRETLLVYRLENLK